MKAILSSPICFSGGTFSADDVPMPDVTGIPHYVGHPATRALLDAAGAVFTPGRYAGPEVGESFIAVPLALNPRAEGYTSDTAVADLSQLRVILVTRVA